MWCFNDVSPRDSKSHIYRLGTIGLNRVLRYNEDAGYTSYNIYYYIKLHVSAYIVVYINISKERFLLKCLRISAGATNFHTFHMSSRETVRL